MACLYRGILLSCKEGKERLIHITWGNLRKIMLNGRRQTEMRMYSLIPLARNSRIDKSNLATGDRSVVGTVIGGGGRACLEGAQGTFWG